MGKKSEQPGCKVDRFYPGRVQHFFLGANGEGEEMRKPRKETLGNTGLFHKMWRGHNRDADGDIDGDIDGDSDGDCELGPEDSESACSDGCSNDGDGFVDCFDWDCGCAIACGGSGCFD